MNKVHLGWLSIPKMGSPVGFMWLGTRLIRGLGSSWMNTISVEFLLFSKMMSVSILFFLTFWEKILRLFLIIDSYNLQLGELNWSWFCGLPALSLNAIYGWTDFSKMDIWHHQQSVCPCNWCIWKNESIVHLLLFWVWEDLFWSLPCSTMLSLCGAWLYVGHYTSGILIHVNGKQKWCGPTSSSSYIEEHWGSC